ncbi:hypothetical protein [Halobaculum sp. D14]|uniref:hypothetical protein n=1 Tax=unclassified Halobaculum TaxID=2640896 RepID=UPI003EBB3E40
MTEHEVRVTWTDGETESFRALARPTDGEWLVAYPHPGDDAYSAATLSVRADAVRHVHAETGAPVDSAEFTGVLYLPHADADAESLLEKAWVARGPEPADDSVEPDDSDESDESLDAHLE